MADNHFTSLYARGNASAAIRDPAHSDFWSNVDDSVPAVIDAYTELMDNEHNSDDSGIDVVARGVLLIRSLTVLLARNTCLTLSVDLRLCLGMFLSERATVVHDAILVEVVKCAEVLIVTTATGLTEAPLPLGEEDESVQTLLSELTGLWQLVCSAQEKEQVVADDANDGGLEFFYSRRQGIQSALVVATRFVTMERTGGSLSSFLQSIATISATALMHGTFNRTHAPSIASQGALALKTLILDTAKEHNSAFAVHAVTQLCKCVRDALDQNSGANLRGQATATMASSLSPSVARPVRNLLSAASSDLTLDVTEKQAVTACLRALSLSMDAQQAGVSVASTGADIPVGDTTATIDAAQWNLSFRRSPVALPQFGDDLSGQESHDAAFDAKGDAFGAADATSTTTEFQHSLKGLEDVPISVQQLVQMVFASLQQLPLEVLSEDGFLKKMHLEGLRLSQIDAARQAQAEEIKRVQLQEAQSIEDIPAGKLFILRSQQGAKVSREAAQALERATMRADLQRRSFLSIVRTFEALRRSTSAPSGAATGGTYSSGDASSLREGKMRGAQALVARTFTQLPASVSDTAADAILELLEAELSTPNVTVAQLSSLGSVYSLILQTLFIKYSETAPFQQQGQQLFNMAGAAVTSLSAAEDHTASIEADNPVGWLSSGRMNTAMGADGTTRKRHRDDDGSGGGGAAFEFGVDTQEESTSYSHFLNRCLALTVEANRVDVTVDCLLHCPAITANTWTFLLHRLCLGERAHCPIGVFAVSLVAQRRPVYICQAVSVLLFLAGCPKVDPRRLAIAQLAKIVDQLLATGTAATNAQAGHIVQTLLHTAMKQIARVPLIRHAKAEPTLQQQMMDDDAETTAQARHHQTILASVDRHLGLFLMLCSRRQQLAKFQQHVSQGGATNVLLGSLVNTFVECHRQSNTTVSDVLLDHPDVLRLIQQLFRDPQDFLQEVLPVMRRNAHQGAHRLVQRIISVVAAEIRSQAMVQRTAASLGGVDHLSSTTDASAKEQLVTIATALAAQAMSLYRDSKLQLSSAPRRDAAAASTSSQQHVMVRDVRFIAPFLGLVSRAELKEADGPLISLLQYTATSEYNEEDVRAALKEIFVKFPLTLSDGVARGISPHELMVFLHQDVLPIAEGKRTSGSPLVTATSLTVPMLKAFVPLCLGLGRTFERHVPGAPLPPMLYDVRACLNLLQALLRVKPFPSLLMFTAIVTCRVHADQPDLTQFVVSNALSAIARDAVWDTDTMLWRDAEFFCEEHWQDTHGFLFNLPDRVLIAALKENARMKEAFVATQSGNASFAHILGAL